MTNTAKSLAYKVFIALLLIFSAFWQSCSEPADKFFDVAVLNTNVIADFGSPILAKHINDATIEFADMPSTKKKGDEATKTIRNDILFMEKALKDIKALSAGNESRKLIKGHAISLYELVIPVYKNEYTAYAKLCDAHAPQDQKDAIINSIDQKYNAEFEKKYTSLLAAGKAFAKENNLNVNWK